MFIACLPLPGQTDSVFDLQGRLERVDWPPDATPAGMPIFHLGPLGGGIDVEARPDQRGSFTLNQVKPGHYSLTFPMPGRIRSFASGSRELAPEDFMLSSGDMGPLLLIVSMQSANVVVAVRALPNGHGNVEALLTPADNRLTLGGSCYSNQLSGSQTTFHDVPPGRYRIVVVDAQFGQDVAAYAPRSSDFLKSETTSVEVPDSGQTQVTATYVDSETVKQAIRRAAASGVLGR